MDQHKNSKIPNWDIYKLYCIEYTQKIADFNLIRLIPEECMEQT